MKNLFEAATVAEVKERVSALRAESERVWGKMNAGQMLAHCSVSLEGAVGDRRPPRIFIGRLLGPIAKPDFLSGKPMKHNSPTDKSFVIRDERDFAAERERLLGLIDRFAAGGPGGCTKHPHSFFGALTPEEWARGMYKHLDHHLQQFGV
jgi:transposase InsO family protein